MKKIQFIISLLSICSFVAYPQLKVTPDGKVGIGITETPISKFAAGTTGDVNYTHVFQGGIVNLRVTGLGNSPYSYGDFGTGLYVSQEVSSSRGDYGVKVNAVKPSPTSSGRAIGLVAAAGNATNGYNWGIIGSLAGSNNGTGVLGCIGYSQGYVIPDGQYAGYFVGNVKVTGTINGVVVGNSDIRYKENVEQINSSAKSTVLSTLMRLNPVSYNLKQIHVDPVINSDSLKSSATQKSRQSLYDEKSPMFRKRHFGLVAQDVQEIYPDLVYENDNGYLSINYIELIPLMIQSIKELKAEIDLQASSSVNDFVKDTSGAQASAGKTTTTSGGALRQNEVSPYTQNTEIKFDLPQNAVQASVLIFNMQGTLLMQLAAESRQSVVTINGSALDAGMYYYSLVVDGKEVDTKRMILTK